METMYTVADLSKILHLHPKTVVRFIHQGKILAQKIGRAWMVTKDALASYTHGELEKPDAPRLEADQIHEGASKASLEFRSADYERCSRMANLVMASLNGHSEIGHAAGFRFSYDLAKKTAYYSVVGEPDLVFGVIRLLDSAFNSM